MDPALYDLMMEQLGLKPQKEKKKVHFNADTTEYQAAEGQELTMNDILSSIDSSATKVKKQLKALKREGPALEAPMPARKRMKMEQEANYDLNKKHMQKWLP